ncbi:uncharacterized protein LOC141675268 [Apium graveolens]|uniref:uncharacterized protein LOC141675268 n=1 Tax=Apium graveolens TaxID=4045 RepID=UPI003D7BF5C6
MDSSVTIYIHHHGDFEHKPKPKYVGGDVEVIPGFAPDLFSFRDLDDFAVKCSYAKSDLVYFKNDGLTFESGMRLLYDDSTVRAMVDIHKPIGKINLYIDHYDVDEVIDNQEDENDNEGGEYGNQGRENENQGGENGIQGGEDGNEGSGDDSDPDDPEYGYEGDDVETESDESEDEKGYDSFCDSDEELREFREKKKKYKDSLKQNHGNLLEVREKVMSLSDDSEYASDELRSDSSSSEDENHKIGYVGPPNPKIKKRKRNSVKYGQKSDTIKWEVGMKFASMTEFRDAVRQYGVVQIRTTRLNEGDSNKFKRIYLCYHALKEGWKAGCRPVIGFDGCFLKTICGGQLLSAVGRDGNNQMYPIAYGVVESENTESWKWFTELLSEDLSLGDGFGYTIISDQQKGLDNALKELLPRVEHRYCARHLYSNFRKRFSSLALKRAFWNACMSPYPAAHARAMKELQRLSKPAHEHLHKLDPKVWTKSHFSTFCKADNVENNMSESFNAWIIHERYMPLLTMMQEIHFKLLTRIRLNRDAMIRSDAQLCPRIKRKLDILVTESRNWRASWNGATRYSVKHGTKVVTVDLDAKSCDCRRYDLTGIPCEHAIAAIHDRRHQPVDYVSDFYKKHKFLASYNFPLEALKGEEFWEVHSTDELLPPDLPKKLRGRPKKMRRKEDWEGGNRVQGSQTVSGPVMQRYSNKRVMHCSLCGDSSHRKTNCPTKKNGAPLDEEAEMRTVEQGDATRPDHNTTSASKKKAPKEMKRQKLQIRRQDKGKAIDNEGQQNIWDGKKSLKVPKKKLPFVKEAGGDVVKKGKDPTPFQENLLGPVGYKAVFMPTPGFVPFLPPRSTPEASTPPALHLSSQHSSTTRVTPSNLAQISNPADIGAQEEAGLATMEAEEEDELADMEAAEEDELADMEAEDPLQPSRRTVRLLEKRAFKWTNTPDDPVKLDD